MKPEIVLKHEFVDYIPEKLEDRTLYISRTYGTAVHRCCCGCGREVVTPLSPTGWQLTFDGESVSLSPSIGSWNLPCQSHYFITNSRVVWVPRWTKVQIERGRAAEARARDRYYANRPRQVTPEVGASTTPVGKNPRESLWQKIKRWFS